MKFLVLSQVESQTSTSCFQIISLSGSLLGILGAGIQMDSSPSEVRNKNLFLFAKQLVS